VILSYFSNPDAAAILEQIFFTQNEEKEVFSFSAIGGQHGNKRTTLDRKVLNR
jgi:hypothetical protein